MLIYAIDPGTEQSALVCYDSTQQRIVEHVIADNDAILSVLLCMPQRDGERALVIEQIESFGMAVGAETFRTVWWAGRFYQAWDGEAWQLPRRAVKLHLCYSARATDANIRTAILDRFGPGKEKAVGKKAAPGPLFGIRSHEWSALSIAITFADKAVSTSVRSGG
jgi:hypothetical protein